MRRQRRGRARLAARGEPAQVAARIDTETAVAAAHQVNAWLAHTPWRGPESILDAVQERQTGELPSRFTLARTILLDERDTAVAMLPDALLNGDVTIDQLRTWPLFHRLHGMSEFDRLIASENEEPPDFGQR